VYALELDDPDNKAGEVSVCRSYFHYFLPKGTKNDLRAVITAHRHLMKEAVMKDATHVEWFSDGGSKHFKMTASLAHMWSLAKKWRGVESMSVNFFASWHGSGPCDAAAAHMKKVFRNKQRDKRIIFGRVEELAEAAAEIQFTQAKVITVGARIQGSDYGKKNFETFTEIMQCHRFTFEADHKVVGWFNSTDKTSHKTKQIVPRTQAVLV